MSTRRAFFSVAFCLALGCSDPAAPVDAGGGGTDTPLVGPDTGPRIDAAGPGGASFTLTFPAVTVAPGAENTQCVVLRLGNPTAINVGEIENMLDEGSHHFIVYRTNATTEQPTPFDCVPFLDTLDPTAGSPLMITQRMDEVLTLPSGVGFPFEANQMIRLEMHFINTGVTGGPIDVSATTTFRTIPDADFTDAADFLFVGTPDITLPARTATTVGPVFFPLPSELRPAAGPLNFFSITGHTHQLGTNVLIWTADSATGPMVPVYDEGPWSWDEPTTRSHTPAFTVPSGGGFRFQCEYDNTTDSAVSFGEATTSEMCFFWAYYYPSVGGGRVCFHTERTGSPIDICCPGGALCSLVEGFLRP